MRAGRALFAGWPGDWVTEAVISAPTRAATMATDTIEPLNPIRMVSPREGPAGRYGGEHTPAY
jgi:hypothetical protein